MVACQKGHGNVATMLIEHGASIQERNNFLRTPLSYACESGLMDVTIKLLELGASINERNQVRSESYC